MKELEIFVGKIKNDYVLFLKLPNKLIQKQIRGQDKIMREIKYCYGLLKFDSYSIKALRDYNVNPKIEPIEIREFLNLRRLCRQSLENCFLLTTSYSVREGVPFH